MEKKPKHFYIEISTLFESHYSGIARVALNTIKMLQKFYPDKVTFFMGEFIVNLNDINQILNSTSGNYLNQKMLENPKDFFIDEIEYVLDKSEENIGIYPFVRMNYKKYFDFEYQIIHDLTAIVTPQFHTAETVGYVGGSLGIDMAISDYLVCVSDATRQDIQTYTQIPEGKLITSTLGNDNNQPGFYDQISESILPAELQNKKFALVLGTIEPRKNNALILKYLDANLNEDLTYVFTGKTGWGKTFEDIVRENVVNFEKVLKRVIYLGYVSDQVRNALFKYAHFSVYPSVYEGFGLPVLESISLGTPVVASYSTSIPEIAGEHAEYFDPFSESGLGLAIKKIKQRINKESDLGDKLINHSKQFTWEKFCNKAFHLE